MDSFKAAFSKFSPLMLKNLRANPSLSGGECGKITRVGLGQNSSSIADCSRKERQELLDHLTRVEDQFNRYFVEAGIPLTVSTAKIKNSIESDESEQHDYEETFKKSSMSSFDGPKGPGFLYENNIRNIVKTIGFVVMQAGKSIHAIGGAQAGKTNFEAGWQLIGPAVFVWTNASAILDSRITESLIYYPILLGPPARSLEAQTRLAMENMFQMYKGLEFLSTEVPTDVPFPKQDGGGFIRKDEFFHRYSRITWKIYETMILKRSTAGTRLELPDKFERRSTKKKMMALRDRLQRVLDRRDFHSRFEVLLIVDEFHHGATDDIEHDNISLMSKFMKEKLIHNGVERSIASIMADPDVLSRAILASATGWPAECSVLKKSSEEMRLPLGDNYHGYNAFNGRVIDGSKRCTRPRVQGFSELAEQAGVPFFKYFSPKAFGSHEKFLQARNGMDDDSTIPASHPAYKIKAIKAFADTVRWMVFGKKGFVSHVCVRLLGNNYLTESIASQVAPLLEKEGISVVTWTGKKNGTVRDLIAEEGKKSNKPLLIFVTGRARMGDDFPAEVRHFLDFVKEIGNLTALDQGLVGRACGYNKYLVKLPSGENLAVGNYVWLNNEEADSVNKYIESSGSGVRAITGKMTHPGMRDDGLKPSDLKTSVGIGYSLGDTKITKWLDDLNMRLYASLDHGEQLDAKSRVNLFRYKEPSFLEGVGGSYKDNIRYLPLFANFDPAKYVSNSPELCNKVMPGVSRIHVYGKEDVLSGAMQGEVDSEYDLDDAGFARINLRHAGKVTNMYAISDSSGVGGEKHQTVLSLKRHGHGSGKVDAYTFTELIIQMVRVDPMGEVVPDNPDGSPNIRGGDQWKVFNVVFLCRKPSVGDFAEPQADLQPDHVFTGQFVKAGV
jgi:hypothetical protein